MRQKQRVFSLFLLSPSSRRAWIEMLAGFQLVLHNIVALLAEGVDRNLGIAVLVVAVLASPSSRRAWIEILLLIGRVV